MEKRLMDGHTAVPGARRVVRGLLQTLLAGTLTCIGLAGPIDFPEPNALPIRKALPDPLELLSGQKVTTAEQWNRERKPELKALFQHYMYGSIAAAPGDLHARVQGRFGDFLGGKATLTLVTLEPGRAPGVHIDLMIVTPNQRPGRCPVFLAMNFCGNHTLTDDPRVPLTRTWVPGSCKACADNHATEASRGAQSADWPLEAIVGRGYGVAAFYSGDIDPDRADVSEGLYAALAGPDKSRIEAANRGTLAAWAWGFQRCVDYLVQDPDVDPTRIAAVGHSRNGKAALLAAAFDERISIAFPHQAGCGGSAPSRGTVGESVKAINDRFPHWFNSNFKAFNEATDRLPFDQNCLVALCAPRAVLFSAAQEDQWANPAGQFEVLEAADRVYTLLGCQGLQTTQMPPLRQLAGKRLGYYIREGKHSMTADDWRVFMDFAEGQWKDPR
ncbi:MAG TPA: acetylxylan esterase [Verrucomicrobiae bacterium]|nr:acetylxylan esterase [Verrucomicrobiae bacterium]